jgi:arabinofuranan 3-O-arabinosyltransferase
VSVHDLRLRSPGAGPRARPTGGGAVLDPGDESRGGHDGVRVRVDGPSWLVLGESYDRGWRAECDGRDLGEPVVIDGYANGWRPPADCRDVTMRFGPQRAVNFAYVFSGVACVLLLLFLSLARSRRHDAEWGGDAELAITDSRERLPFRTAVAAGVLAAVVFGFAFSLRAGVAIGPGMVALLWLGLGVRVLVACAGGLLGVVVPAIYLIFPPEDRGGYNPGYPVDVLGAHWVGVAAFVFLFVALTRSLRTARDPRGGPAPAPAAAGAPQARP